MYSCARERASCWSPPCPPVIGYDKASAIAHKANDEATPLRGAAPATGYIDAADFDRIVNPAAMTGLRQGVMG
jgi:fumarate hydratase class II